MSEHDQDSLPKRPEPYWRISTQLANFPPLKENMTTDVTVIGGGISGITTAYLLAKEGLEVTLLEADVLVNGTSGHTTAKITAQHDLIYDELIQHVGAEKAKLYYDANDSAIQFIRTFIKEENVACDFTDEDAYLYTTNNRGVSKLEHEYKAYQELGIPSKWVTSMPLDIPIKAGIVMHNQAQFHPIKYLAHLIKRFTEMGGKIYEQTVATDVKEGSTPTVVTRDGHKISTKYVVAASHFPFYDGAGFYFSRMHAERSYVIAAETEKEFPGGMYLSCDNPKRSLRYTDMDGKKLVIIGGEQHKAGQGMDTMYHYEALQAFGHDVFGTVTTRFRWSAQDLVTLDNIPYIGKLSRMHPNIFVATGFRKWGMTHGTVAAQVITDLVLERPSPYESLYKPSRFVADPSIKHFMSQNIDVSKHLIKGKFGTDDRKVDDLAKDEGSVVDYNGQRAGAYRDHEGSLHVVDTTCTHMRCELNWNHGDRSWDCPCHGSRFSYKGDVMEGPATKPLKVLEE
ncbi:FAD-dependent oxidoreductase [Bacillus sp. FJAT-45037]|uniref:FAD-dependent oxidoreductase n=1 Tax=Bacillus sp. FJAT-45037 TaxID=2011007 RepID=UPI000C248920|nr:FAD-dependent oxidoreductase [Bacillus sp. FJAT-45037]